MITDIPTSKDFMQAGSSYLNLAWSQAIDLSLTFAELAEHYFGDDEIPVEYWKAAQRPLATSLSLLQQGAEFLLKSKIAAVSPFLLFSGSPKDWPKGCQVNDVSFSEFRTIDAQELVRAVNAVSDSKLPDAFAGLFDSLRQQRNKIMHSIDPNARFSVKEVLLNVLLVSETIFGDKQWPLVRLAGIEEEPNNLPSWGGPDRAPWTRECLHLVELLSPAELKRHFDFNPKSRRYYCIDCHSDAADWDLDVNVAQLKSKDEKSDESLFCFICQTATPIRRENCSNQHCNGDIFDLSGTCVSCIS